MGDPTAGGGGDFHKHSCTSLKQIFLNVYGSTRTNLSECRAVVGCSKLFSRCQPQLNVLIFKREHSLFIILCLGGGWQDSS